MTASSRQSESTVGRPALRVAHRLRRLAVLDADPERRRASLEKEVRAALDAADTSDQAALLAELGSYFPTSEDDLPPAWWHAHVPAEGAWTQPAPSSRPIADDASTIAPPQAMPSAPAPAETPDSAELPDSADMPDMPEPQAEDDGLLELDEFEPLDDETHDEPNDAGAAGEEVGAAADREFDAIESASPEMTLSPPNDPPPLPPPPAPPPAAAPAPAASGANVGDFTLIDEGSVAPPSDGPNYADQLDAGAPEEPPSISPLQSMPPSEQASPEDEASDLLARLELLRSQLDDAAWQRAVAASGSSLATTPTTTRAPASSGDGAELDLDDHQRALTMRYWQLEPKLRRRWNLSGRDVIDPSRAAELADAVGPHLAAIDTYVRDVWAHFKTAVEDQNPAATQTLITSRRDPQEMPRLTRSMLLGGLRSRSHHDGRRLRRDLAQQLKLATGIIAGINGVGPRISDRVLRPLDPDTLWSQEIGFGEGGGGGWLGRGGDKEQATKARCWDRFVTLYREVEGHGVSGEVVRHIIEYVEPFLAGDGDG